MNQPAELPSDIYEQVVALTEKGNDCAGNESYREAFNHFREAWELLPEPKTDWNASTWILASMADVCFFGGKIKQARQALESVFLCPNALGNSFIHRRFEQVLYEEGEFDLAADQLMRAYMAGGAEEFELEDAKYIDFLKTRADI